jgi:hypothetical protein
MQSYKQWIKPACFGVMFIALMGILVAQLPSLPKIPKGVTEKIPDLNKILEGEPPVTTSINDAVTDIAFLDDFEPAVLTPMEILPRTETGGFVLERPGFFVVDLESYCLRAGTYAPSKGDGYLYAPIKGSQSDIIRSIMQRSYQHPEIEQRDIQVLVWAIIARTKLSDMPREKQTTAAKLLTPKELFEVNGGALGLVPESQFDNAFANMPDGIRQVLEAEARMREMLTEGQAKYEDLEKVAVLHGAAPLGEGSREVPKGRWSYHPDGYFIRYFVFGYPHTQIQLSIPGKFTLKRDAKKRITLIADQFGNRIETIYDDNTTPLTVSGDPSVRGYRIKSIRLVARAIYHPEVIFNSTLVLKNPDWVFVGIPSGKGNPSASNTYYDAPDRYDYAGKHIAEIARIDEYLNTKGSGQDLMDLAHYAKALKNAINNNSVSNVAWTAQFVSLVKEAWQYAFVEHQGAYQWACLDCTSQRYQKNKVTWLKRFWSTLGTFLHEFAYAGSNGKPTYKPEDDIGTPGNTNKQREEKSPCQKAKNPPCDQMKLLEKYIEFTRKRAGYYKSLADQATDPNDLDRLVNEAMDNEYKKAQAKGDIQTEGKQQSGGHYNPCTGEKFVHNMCKFIKDKPLCDWLTRGTNTHENTHEQDAQNWADQRRYCSDRTSGEEQAKIAGKWENNAYNKEADVYDAILDSLKKEHPDCLK